MMLDVVCSLRCPEHMPPSVPVALGGATPQVEGPVWEREETCPTDKERLLYMFKKCIVIIFKLLPMSGLIPEEAGRYFPIRTDKGGEVD